MATLSALTQMNIIEAQKRAGFTDAEDFLGDLVQNNDFLNLVPFLESSDGMFHKYLSATKLGEGSWGKVNSPVGKISSQSDLEKIPVHIYEADSEIDERIFKSGTAEQKKKVRMSEDIANLEGFMQDWMNGLIYGAASAGGYEGLANIRGTIDNKTVWSAGGSTSGSLTSLWLFEFGKNAFNLRYPSGSRPGFNTDDRGRHKVDAPTGNGQLWAWITHMEILAAIQIKRAGALQRMANIAISGSSNIFSPSILIKMKNQLPNMGRNAVAFVNRTVHGQVEDNAYNKSNMAYKLSDIENFGPVPTVAGIPVMTMEAITDTETTVS